MEPGEWKALEAAIIQRATLFNSILADLYGPQRLLREGLLPAELVFPNPAFLRACWGIEPPGGVFLHIYAADLARSPDGQWWVLADRTQAPSGAGYALENRLVTTRVLPDVFRESHVRRLASFFQSYRDALERLVPTQRENPRIVLLTPGPYNETYFEHAFLARYLGYTLVEGGDLTVRDNRVFLKTLGGLLPVDVIVRRQDDHFCDPLELRGDSMLGVPGLVQAVRVGPCRDRQCASGPGLRNRPRTRRSCRDCARHLLRRRAEDADRRDLVVRRRRSRWPTSLEHLDELVIKPTFPGTHGDPIFAAKLSAAGAGSADRARARPSPIITSRRSRVALSTVPVWDDGKLHPRHMVMRVFAVAAGDSYVVMPGGLTRISTSLDNMVVSMQSGGGSKDTWVLGDGPVPPFSLLRPADHPLEVSRATFDLPSRVADNLFWLGRYAERVEAGVRVARTILPRFFQEGDSLAGGRASSAGLDILEALGYLGGEARTATAEREVLAMIYDPEAPNGFVANIHQVRRLAWLLRDRISVDAWLHSESARSAVLVASSGRGRAGRRGAGFAESCRDHAVRIRRTGDGKHDARRRLALSGYRAAAGTGAADDRAAAQQPGTRGRREFRNPRGCSRNGRQLHHLPVALSDLAASRPAARSAAGRRGQSALDCVPIGAADGSTSSGFREPRPQIGVRRKRSWRFLC